MMLDSLLCPGSVAVIGASPDPHKTEAGGVRLGIADAAGLEAAFDAVMASAARLAPDANPVIVYPAGQGCTIADALPVLSPTGAEGA